MKEVEKGDDSRIYQKFVLSIMQNTSPFWSKVYMFFFVCYLIWFFCGIAFMAQSSSSDLRSWCAVMLTVLQFFYTYTCISIYYKWQHPDGIMSTIFNVWLFFYGIICGAVFSFSDTSHSNLANWSVTLWLICFVVSAAESFSTLYRILPLFKRYREFKSIEREMEIKIEM